MGRWALTPVVHSLLRLARIDALEWESAPPEWAFYSLQRAPWVVVRRLAPRGDFWPVGVRGESRSQRAAAWLPMTAVTECATPQSLLKRHSVHCFARDPLAVFAALPAAAKIFHAHRLAGAWGPGGSVSFELASGLPTATASSDLDLIIYAKEPGGVRNPALLLSALSKLAVRADVLIETPQGGVLLAELSAGGPMLLRSAAGPRLVRSPWDDVGAIGASVGHS
jgi:phosphoribosyl-dephospho-CoA transferase